MNKFMYVFMAMTAVAIVAYISLATRNHHPILKPLSNASHSLVSGFIRKAHKILHMEKDKHQEKLKQDFSAHNKTRNETSVNQTVSSDSDMLRGNGSLQTKSQKYLIYLCHHGSCGGWSDRQRGLLSVYILSLVTDRKFGIVMDKPCNVTHFYVPHDVNWIISAAELKNKTSVVINGVGSRGGIQGAIMRGFNEQYHQDVVYIKTNNGNYHAAISKIKRYAKHLPKWAMSKQRVRFATGWKTLMKPSQYLQHRLDDYLQSINYEQRTRPLVCSHVRTGRSDTLKTGGRIRMNVSDITTLWKFLDPYVQNGSKLFLATDNLQVRNLARQRFGENMSDTGGSIVHVDRNTGVKDACGGFGYAVLDQLILSKCDVLVLTGSGFGFRASFLRATDKNLFLFARNKIKKMLR